MSGAEKLFDAITEVREELIDEALDYRFVRKKAIHWQRYAALAACLALVVCIGYLAANLRMGGMNAASNDGSNGAAAGDAADAGDSTGAAPEDGNTADGAMPPPNDAGGGTGEAAPAHGSTVPALSLAEEDSGVTAVRTLTLEFASDGAVYATDVYTLTNAGTESVTVTLTFDGADVSCTVDGTAVESGAHVSLLKAGGGAEVVLHSTAAVEDGMLALASPENLTVAESVLMLQNLPEGLVVSGTEPFDRIVQE